MTHAATNFFRGRNFTMANKLLLSVTAVALASAALASSPAAAQNRQQKAQAAGDYGTINDSYMDPVGAIQNAWNNPGANKAPNQETRSEEHTSELQSLMRISYAVFCFKK